MAQMQTTAPPIETLIMHVEIENQRVYSGVVDREKSPLEWIPCILKSASRSLGKDIESKQTHPNDLDWTYNNPNQANLWCDSLKIDAKFSEKKGFQ
jgi:hypothetical protein